MSDLSSDDRPTALRAIRDKLAVELAAAEGQNAATLARVLVDVTRELAKIDAVKERSTADELAQRRRARRTAPNQERAAGSEHLGR